MRRKGQEDEGLHFIRLDKFMRGRRKETEEMGGNVNLLYSFILFPFNIERIGKERKSF